MVALLQLRGADKSCKEDSFLEMYGDQLLDMGITNVYQMARNDKETLIEMIKKHHIYYRYVFLHQFRIKKKKKKEFFTIVISP